MYFNEKKKKQLLVFIPSIGPIPIGIRYLLDPYEGTGFRNFHEHNHGIHLYGRSCFDQDSDENRGENNPFPYSLYTHNNYLNFF